MCVCVCVCIYMGSPLKVKATRTNNLIVSKEITSDNWFKIEVTNDSFKNYLSIHLSICVCRRGGYAVILHLSILD